MSYLNQIESLAFFGSVPRGDADTLSDMDVLVVAERPSPDLEAALQNAGYSPSVYQWEQLDNLSMDGSLFLQHLKQESRIILDRRGRLTTLLSQYKPTGDYSERLANNLSLFELTNGVPDEPVALAWAFDVLAVALRNHAILQLAQSGHYVFSYPELIARLASTHLLSRIDSQLLFDLRRLKRVYRVHPYVAEATLTVLQRTQAVIERITGADCLSLRLSPQQFVARQLSSHPESVHWYHLLRRYEGAYRAMGFVPQHDSAFELREIERIFAKPSPYSMTGSDAISWVRHRVEALATNWLMDITEIPVMKE